MSSRTVICITTEACCLPQPFYCFLSHSLFRQSWWEFLPGIELSWVLSKLNNYLFQVVIILRDNLYQMYINLILIMYCTAYIHTHTHMYVKIASCSITVHQEESQEDSHYYCAKECVGCNIRPWKISAFHRNSDDLSLKKWHWAFSGALPWLAWN